MSLRLKTDTIHCAPSLLPCMAQVGVVVHGRPTAVPVGQNTSEGLWDLSRTLLEIHGGVLGLPRNTSKFLIATQSKFSNQSSAANFR